MEEYRVRFGYNNLDHSVGGFASANEAVLAGIHMSHENAQINRIVVYNGERPIWCIYRRKRWHNAPVV